ncbi:hypothetical protein [Sinorhizobium meliloti]|uniref:hypothetical protein n=1 Tax=Rhizobium meliloti TaxID=382 RepID=UPI001F396F06|nr:hypothetical protein [Sinorhizobium meliloti]
MEFRNAKYGRPDNSVINVEYNHPKHGWIPFTANPNDVENHGRELFDLASAGTVAPYVPLTTEETRQNMRPLTARQFRLGLVGAGLTPAQVTATIEAMPAGSDKETALIEWEYATTFNRMHPLIATVGAALGLTDEQIDAMWTASLSL